MCGRWRMIQSVSVIATASSLTAIETAIQVELVTSGEERGSLTNANARSAGKPALTASTAAVAPTPTPVTNTAINATNQNSTACSRVGISLFGGGATLTVVMGVQAVYPRLPQTPSSKTSALGAGRVSSENNGYAPSI